MDLYATNSVSIDQASNLVLDFFSNKTSLSHASICSIKNGKFNFINNKHYEYSCNSRELLFFDFNYKTMFLKKLRFKNI